MGWLISSHRADAGYPSQLQESGPGATSWPKEKNTETARSGPPGMGSAPLKLLESPSQSREWKQVLNFARASGTSCRAGKASQTVLLTLAFAMVASPWIWTWNLAENVAAKHEKKICTVCNATLQSLTGSGKWSLTPTLSLGTVTTEIKYYVSVYHE